MKNDVGIYDKKMIVKFPESCFHLLFNMFIILLSTGRGKETDDYKTTIINSNTVFT
jgi:hypothetical protein